MYACDYLWWQVHHKATAAFKGERWTQDANAADRFGLNHIPGRHDVGLGTDCIHFGNNSGYQAINLAYLAGAKTVLLLGFDMSWDGERSHWFGDHQGRLKNNTDYAKCIRAFELMEPEKYGLQVINCTRRTALKCFPTARLEDALLQFASGGSALPA